MTSYFVRNPISAWMLFLAVGMAGAMALIRLPVSLTTESSLPALSVIMEYPGGSPDKIESLIIIPAEKQVKTVQGIQKIVSVCEEGKCRINIHFIPGTDMKTASLWVREKIGLIRHTLPREMQEPLVLRYNSTDRPVLIATIDKDGLPPEDVREIAEREIKPLLQRIEGVSEVAVAGGVLREIHIDLDRGRFGARDISLDHIARSVQRENLSLPAGLIETAAGSYHVYCDTRYHTVRDIAATALMKTADASLVRISDIATVHRGIREKESIARLNGAERVTLFVHRAGDGNTHSVCKKTAAVLARLKDYRVTMIYNQGEYIGAAIASAARSCLWGMLIVMLVLALFMKTALPVFAVALAVPVSVLFVFSGMYALEMDITVMTISGIALGAGMVVDNGIVVTEAVYTTRTSGTGSIIDAVSKIRGALISSTATTMGAFTPIVFGSLEMRTRYGGLAFTVSAALMASLAAALILIPVCYGALSRTDSLPKALYAPAAKAVKHRNGFHSTFSFKLHRLIKKFADRFRDVEENFKEFYIRILEKALRQPVRTVIFTASAACLGILTAFALNSDHSDPFSPSEFYVYCEFPGGTSVEHMDRATRQAENLIAKMNIAERTGTRIEKWRGTITVCLKTDHASRRKQDKIKNEVRQRLNEFLHPLEGFAHVSEPGEQAAREIHITFLGKDSEVLKSLARKAASRIAALQEIEDCLLRFRQGRPEYRLVVERDKATALDVSPHEIGGFFRSALFGPVVTKFIEADRELDVRMRFRPSDRNSLQGLLSYELTNSKGRKIPIKDLVLPEEGAAPGTIWRNNGRRAVTITARIGTLPYGKAVPLLESAMRAIYYPHEYGWEFDDEVRDLMARKEAMAASIFVAVLTVYMILAVLFESLILPLLMMVTVPLSAAGAFFLLFLTCTPVTPPTVIGLIVLAGIAVNNGILLIHSLQRECGGPAAGSEKVIDIIINICRSRFRPVIMTTLTTVMGLFPMLLGGGAGHALWRPLAITVTGGLLFSALLTLISIPALFYLLINYRIRRAQL